MREGTLRDAPWLWGIGCLRPLSAADHIRTFFCLPERGTVNLSRLWPCTFFNGFSNIAARYPLHPTPCRPSLAVLTIVPFRKPGDKRRFKRLAARKDAVIVLPDSGQRISVRITDLSAGGARIALSGKASLPERFSLIRDLDGPEAVKTVNCCLRWQRGMDAGVSFF